MATVNSATPGVRAFVSLGRVFLALAAFALLGAWISQFTSGVLLGMSQQHLYSDAAVLALLGIGMLLDALLHSRSV